MSISHGRPQSFTFVPDLVLNLRLEFFQALSLLFKLSSLLFFHVFDDLGINLLEEFIGLSQYLFNVLGFEGRFHDVPFLFDSRLS